MADKEKISGQRVHKILQDIQKERTVLSLYLIGREYERLTIITGISKHEGNALLTVDCPKGFREIVGEERTPKFLFQFVGKDKINYSFKADLKDILENDLSVSFPDFIEKMQRRRFFRLVPPLGTKIMIPGVPRNLELHVVDVGEGGAMASETRPGVKNFCLKADQRIHDITLASMDKEPKVEIKIEESLVRRVFKNKTTGKYSYALQFKVIAPQDRHSLIQWILNCQREALKKRNLLEGTA